MPKQPLITKEFLEKYAETENWFNYPKILDELAAHPQFSTYVEVGVWKGHSTRYFVKKLQESNREFSYFAVDLWDRLPKDNELWEAHPEQMPYLRHIYNFNLINSNTRKDVFDMIVDSAEAATKFKDEAVDCCFLDASHDEESVAKDLVAWFPKIRNGGILCGHDIHHAPVQKAVKEFFDSTKQRVEFNENTDVWAVIKRIKN